MSRYPARSLLISVIACVAALTLAGGCGSGGGGTTSSGTAASQASAPASSTGGGKPKLGAAVCRKLLPLIKQRVDAGTGSRTAIRVRSSGTSALSKCSFSSRVVTISVSLDTATESHKRFSNRAVEAIQFENGDPAAVPRDVPGVGDPKVEFTGAVWISSRAQLLAIRGNRLLVVGFYIQGTPDKDLRDGAAALARKTYEITPRS